ncbi:MAG: hypothetical protein HFI80_09655 [Lachnospiraceae bacterium]|jgi:hypothetical protein|nr:hypothetical protein [Lachnospiraceae bacterium]
MKWLCVYEEKCGVEGELYSSCERTYNDFGQVLEEKFHSRQGDIKNSYYNYNDVGVKTINKFAPIPIVP